MANQRSIPEEVAWAVERSSESLDTLRKKFRSSWSGFYRFISSTYERRSEIKLRDLANALDSDLTLALEPYKGLELGNLSFELNRDAPIWLQQAARYELEMALKAVSPPGWCGTTQPFLGWFLGSSSVTFFGDEQPSPVDVHYLLVWQDPHCTSYSDDLPHNAVLSTEKGDSMPFTLWPGEWAFDNPNAAGHTYREWQPLGLCTYPGGHATALGRNGRAEQFLIRAASTLVANLKGYLDLLERIHKNSAWRTSVG